MKKGSTMEMYDIKDPQLAKTGQERIEWAQQNMPVLGLIKEEFAREKPLSGIKIGACLHVTTETANLMMTLKAGGAQVALCASNPLSTQDDVAAALVVNHDIPVFAVKGEDSKLYYRHIESALNFHPHITMDDGADLIATLHSSYRSQLPEIIGGTEETTTGVIRLKQMEKDGTLAYPIIAVNESRTKHLFDNRYGTGQSTIDGILRATNKLLAGSIFVAVGYGWCGRGIAMRARGMGSRVIVTEIDPVKALEAVMEGYEVMPIREAAKVGDIFLTATGNLNCIRKEHFKTMKNGAIMANSGHFNVEIDAKSLREMAVKTRKIRETVEEFILEDGKKLYLLAEGRLVNLAAAEGHPAQVMDMSFANQALASVFLVTKFNSKNKKDRLLNKVHKLNENIDQKIARLKLRSMDLGCDVLTREQKEYLDSWTMGT